MAIHDESAPLLSLGDKRGLPPPPRLASYSMRGYILVLILLVLFNVTDNVLVVVLFDEFPEEFAQYVNQGTVS